MNRPIVYADFHGLRPSTQTSGLSIVPLNSYGSLRDLSNQQIRLKEGMALTIYMDSDETQDIEADGVAYYNNELGFWLVEIDETKIRDVPLHDTQNKQFLCVSCRHNLASFLQESGHGPWTSSCPICNTPVTIVITAPSTNTSP